MVPYIEISEYRKVHSILVPLLEEAIGGQVYLIAHRRILRREMRGQRLLKQKRPVSRTLVRHPFLSAFLLVLSRPTSRSFLRMSLADMAHRGVLFPTLLLQ
jgi:hypothetical protein